MEGFKANMIIFGSILILGGLLFWAIQSINGKSIRLSENTHINDVSPVVTSDPIGSFSPDTETPTEGASGGTETSSGSVAGSTTENPPEQTTPPSSVASGEHADLIDELQELIDDKVFMKKGSRGTRVGTVQKFLIEYGVEIKVDNDYGDSVVSGVKKFQQEQKISADGQAGPTTYEKMIAWLNNN
jgi:hypothetical protein